MSFFDAPPPDPPAPPPMPPPQDWMAPPEGWLGGYVPFRVELARAPGILVLLGPMEAFPTGVRFQVVTHSREPSHGPGPMGPLGPDARIGVSYSDGSKWQGFRQGFDPFTPPPAPNVMFNGGGGGGTHWAQQLWLWPLPPPGPVTFGLAAPSIGIEEATAAVEGAVLLAAAEEAEQLWVPLSPDEMRERHQLGRAGAFGSSMMLLHATAPDPPDEEPELDED